jgi:hypothetical protein
VESPDGSGPATVPLSCLWRSHHPVQTGHRGVCLAAVALQQRDQLLIALPVGFRQRRAACINLPIRVRYAFQQYFRHRMLSVSPALIQRHSPYKCDFILPIYTHSSIRIEAKFLAAAREGDPEILRMALERVDVPLGDPRWNGLLLATIGFWNHWIARGATLKGIGPRISPASKEFWKEVGRRMHR